jgi:hypothetical protein
MPFTLSHPAATLPIRALVRGRLPLGGLVVGSMMPDLGYYFAPVPAFHGENHTLLRSFTFCLPWGLALLAVVTLLEEGWQELLPAPLRPEGPIVTWSLRTLPALAAAIVVGTWTHLLWDAWTHWYGWFVELFPVLRTEVAGVPLCTVLQHLSTLVGAAVLLFSGRHRLRRVRFDWRCGFWLGAGAVATAAALGPALMLPAADALVPFVTSAVRDLVLITAAAAFAVRALKLVAARVRSVSDGR